MRRAAVALVLLAGACKAETTAPTQTIVIVDAEPGVRARTAVLRLVVTNVGDGEMVHQATLRAEDGEIELPWLLALVPKEGDASREFEVVATALDGADAFVAEARARSGFVEGEKRSLFLLLEDACIGVTCGSEETCRGGGCEDSYVDPRDLPVFDADELRDAEVIGLPEPDAGADAGVGSEDAGEDAALGEGDGGASAGCRPNPDTANEVCTEICPETCNDEDDDCDLKIDEGSANADCEALPNATGECRTGNCIVVECEQGYKNCDGEAVTGCESDPDDVDNCGKCDQACDFPNMIAACDDGTCIPVGCVDDFGDCDTDPEDCETPTTTLIDCGDCGTACEVDDLPNAADVSCETGDCAPAACIDDYGNCNAVSLDGCEQELNALAHCTACALLCDFPGGEEQCAGGFCTATACDAGYDDCDGDMTNGCESLSSDAHCGACAMECDATLDHVASAGCVDGQCLVTCPDEYGDCDVMNPFNGCEEWLRTPTDCGACGVQCARDHAVASCATGVCVLGRCDMGWDDCDLNEATGCEEDLNLPENCGSCGNVCGVGPNFGKDYCAGGECTTLDCPGTTADCNEMLPDMCEVDLATDEANCGQCNFPCEFDPLVVETNTTGLLCIDSACTPQCDAGFEDCNGDYLDGCEQSLATLAHCGSCFVPCAIENATATCDTGACLVAQCDDDWGDCEPNGTDCETSLATTSDCGACGNACDSLTNAVGTCGGDPGTRACEIATCTQTYYENCDMVDATGCEVDTRSDVAHCGACDDPCPNEPNTGATTCTDGICGFDCLPGYGDCDDGPGCETPLGTTTHCSACGDACALLSHTDTTACNTNVCNVVTCDAGFEDCDGLQPNGCETSVYSTANCGDCAGGPNFEQCELLPNVLTSSCPAGDCQIDACADAWLDCDGDGFNGCEHDGRAPGAGGLGPCEPDTNCFKDTYAGQTYWFCTNDRVWSNPIADAGARQRCQLQLLGDLVRIDDAAENDFVLSNLAEASWIGGTDGVNEGQWFWAIGAEQFWAGGPASGGGSGLLYANWTVAEPDDTGDCARIALVNGTWLDESCGTARGFVCEVQSDLCPGSDKSHPGQCGCDVLDVHTDGDGTADCNEECDSDPFKLVRGVCGCGVPDTDTDMDGTADCVDVCPDDADHTDTDTDTAPDCADTCPYDPAVVIGDPATCGFGYTPTNFTLDAVTFAGAPNAILRCGTTTVDTKSLTLDNWCGDEPVLERVGQLNGPDIVVIALTGLTIAEGSELVAYGPSPLVLAVRGDVAIAGRVSVASFGTSAGAGGGEPTGGSGYDCILGGSGSAGAAAGASEGGGGGGGGAFGLAGADGGQGAGSTPNAGGAKGVAESNKQIVPLRGGCEGGRGGIGPSVGATGGPAGAGGGAVQISAAGLVQFASTAVVTASGGGGLRGAHADDGGGGGGSGGAVVIEGPVVVAADGAWITANGGGGGGGNGAGAANGGYGTDGYASSGQRAPGGSGTAGGGAGGFGGALAGGAAVGANGNIVVFIGAGAGGAGGGGVGRVRVSAAYGCALSGLASPSAYLECP